MLIGRAVPVTADFVIMTVVMIVVMVLAWIVLVNHVWRRPVWLHTCQRCMHDSPALTVMWNARLHRGGGDVRGTFGEIVAIQHSGCVVNSWW